jgi:hypothetical protein
MQKDVICCLRFEIRNHCRKLKAYDSSDIKYATGIFSNMLQWLLSYRSSAIWHPLASFHPN